MYQSSVAGSYAAICMFYGTGAHLHSHCFRTEGVTRMTDKFSVAD